MNLKNPALDLIRRIHPECGFYVFMIRFWTAPKNSKSVFGFGNPDLDLEIRIWIWKSGFGFGNPDLDSEIRIWIWKSGFGFGNPYLDFPEKTHPNIHVSSNGVSKKSNC